LINVDRGLYEPVGIHEVPAFHSEKKMSCARLFPFFITVPVATDVFFVWCRQTPLDELYGIIDPLIDVDRGLYEPVGIHEVPAFHFEKKNPRAVLFHFSSQFLSFYRKGLVLLSRFKPLLILLHLS
jgi:hypothetical protein